MSKLLVIEDEADIAAMVRAILRRAGYDVTTAADGKSGLDAFHREPPDLILLDIGLPDVDGWEVLSRIRDASEVPVMMLTAYSGEEDKVRGLRGGADDYLTKPFGANELIARVETLLRRAATADPLEANYDDGLVRIDVARHEVRVQGRPVSLTPTEFLLLSILVHNQGRVLRARTLLTRVWDDPTGLAPERVKYTVRRLRHKLGWTAGAASPLEAVRGYGYRYKGPGGARAAKAAGSGDASGTGERGTGKAGATGKGGTGKDGTSKDDTAPGAGRTGS